jgi:hypothetical protein
MKHFIFLAAMMLLAGVELRAQILKPVKWSYGAKKVSETEAIVFLRATIDSGWHVYSQRVKPGGPIPTSFSFDKSADYDLVGKTTEPKPITRMEKVFGMNVSYFERGVIFQQKLKLKKGSTMVTGRLGYMTCNDKECLPPDDVRFSIPIN